MCCLPDLIAWSGFGVAPVDGIVMNVLVVEKWEGEEQETNGSGVS